MSVALYIVAEQEIPGFDLFVNGKALGHSDELDQLAESAGVRPLMEFCSQGPEELEAFLDSEGMEPFEGDLPPEEWFTPEEGLKTIRGMLAFLASNPTAMQNASALVEDLKQFEEVLGRLASEEVRWHLAVDL